MRPADVPMPRPRPPLSHVLTGLSLSLFIVAAAAHAVDARVLGGTPVWAKPMKFAASFVVLFATIAWLENRLTSVWREGWMLRSTMAIMGTAMVTEMGYILYQAAQAQPSHFNYSTPLHEFMYTVVMFGGALALVAGIGVYAFAAARDHGAELTVPMRWGVVWGFGLSFALTVVVAGYMGAISDNQVGTPPADPTNLPIFGWSLDIGDLRPAHFLSLHAMQALPIFAFAVERFSVRRPRLVVSLAAGAYAALTLALFAQALAGQPIF